MNNEYGSLEIDSAILTKLSEDYLASLTYRAAIDHP